MAPDSAAVEPAAQPQQLSLSPIEQRFAASGVDEVPVGYADLTAREAKFVLGVLEHGQMARAARDAGYSEASAGAIATETLRKPKVWAFYRRCLEKVASKAEQLSARVYERSVMLHAKALEAGQQIADANEWILKVSRDEYGAKHGAKSIKEFEQKRERAQRDEKHYITLANQTDALLGQLLGKIAGVHVSGEVKHSHKHEHAMAVTVPEDALPALAQLRREVITARAATGGPN